MPDDDKTLLGTLTTLTEAIRSQNDLIAQLPEIALKVKILWTVLGIVCGTALVGFLTWVGHMLLTSGGN